MRDRLIICNDDGIQMLHSCAPGHVETSIRSWVDFFLQDCHVDVLAFCTAFPDKTHHETAIGERYMAGAAPTPSQSQLHNKQCLDELRDAGTDILHVVADQVRLRGKRVLASIRMSDVHHASDLYQSMAPAILREHPEWRILLEDGSPDVALDYSHAGVREHRLAIIGEILETHAVGGIELDFMRSCRYFPSHLAQDRLHVMNDFVCQVHDLIVAGNQSQRHLGVRLPPSLAECAGLGLDPATWIQEGWVDYVAPSDFMWLDYGTRVEDFAALCEGTDCGVYPCLNPFAAEWVNHRAVNAYTPNPVNFNRRVFFSDEQIRGCLRNFDRWGGDGVYTFNFCCETIDNPGWVKRVHDVAAESPKVRQSQPASYSFLPIWRADRSPSGAEQSWRTLQFGAGQGVLFPFRVADGCGKAISGRLRFRVYNLHDQDILEVQLNGDTIPDAAIIERRKTNIHVAADTRYPGMHVPPHIAYEIDLGQCPALRGDNELHLEITSRAPSVDSECMVEAMEIDVGHTGTLQTVGYLLDR
ncbi:MAG: hypothetical protein HN712_08905 [Gemmatimonadetes bacterium]|jgi:hypothetical protein|nr:hypothetical protein [Gemmatimonadota bacterium]MBT7860420.1 hypothetical protein [Gemmatimonadota bacterium]